MSRYSKMDHKVTENLEMWNQMPDITRIVHALAESNPEIKHRIPYTALDTVLGLEDVVRRLSENWRVPEREATKLISHAMFPLLQELRIWARDRSLRTMREPGDA